MGEFWVFFQDNSKPIKEDGVNKVEDKKDKDKTEDKKALQNKKYNNSSGEGTFR